MPGGGGCLSSLACVPIDAAHDVGFCSPICTAETAVTRCSGGKRCALPPGDSRGVCLDLATNGAACAPDLRRFCDPATHSDCLLLQQGDATGICFTLCHLKALKIECPDPQRCMGLLGDPTLGVCLAVAGTGKRCGLDVQTLCDVGDLCVGEQLANGNSSFSCVVDCTSSGVCDGAAKCTVLSDGATKGCL